LWAMNFLALFVGLGLERLLTHLFHLREFHWLDPLLDRLLSDKRLTQPNLAIAAAAVFTALLVLPVGLIEIFLSERLAYIPPFLFAVVVLLFCLGPRDLGKEVDDYCEALQAENQDEVRAIAHELLERWPEPDKTAPDIEPAIYAQANNRIFGVVFWFVMLGPSGAWLFRVLDLMRHRAAQQIETLKETGGDIELPRIVQAVLLLHFLIAWIPGRLLAIGYILAGNYDGAVAAWKELRTDYSAGFPGPTDQLLGVVGKGAASWGGADDDATGRIFNARTLVFRTLWLIWCPVLALLTLYDLLA
jgi:AmpE protein